MRNSFTYELHVFLKQFQNPLMASFITKTHIIPTTPRLDISDSKETAISTKQLNKHTPIPDVVNENPK